MINLDENNIYFYFNKNKLVKKFNEYKKFGNIYYPLKTNSNKIVLNSLKPLIDEGNHGFLISSIANFELLKEEKVDLEKICFINVLAEKNTIKYLYENGVTFFTFDNMTSLIEFSKYADLSKVKIAIRLSTMEVFTDKFIHLGAPLKEALDMLRFLKDKCNNCGLSFYMQSDLKTKENVLENILKFIESNFNSGELKFISIGGLKQSTTIDNKLLTLFKKRLDINELILEVGRHLVEETIEMETRIIREKMIGNLKTIIIKNGIYSGFFDVLLYNRKFSIFFKSKNDGEIKIEYEKSDISDYEFYMCGGSSDSGDKIGRMYINSKYKDELIVGGKFIVKNVGAYFEEFFIPHSQDLIKVFVEE